VAARDIHGTRDEKQHRHNNETEIQHSRYHTPVLLPMTHTAPINPVF
jgi:hypothetical protein